MKPTVRDHGDCTQSGIGDWEGARNVEADAHGAESEERTVNDVILS
jgi:hypothetical protein